MWEIIQGPLELEDGSDAERWGWKLKKSTDVMTAIVKVARSAISSETVPDATRLAIETKGRSVVETYLHLARPPKEVLLASTSIEPIIERHTE